MSNDISKTKLHTPKNIYYKELRYVTTHLKLHKSFNYYTINNFFKTIHISITKLHTPKTMYYTKLHYIIIDVKLSNLLITYRPTSFSC